MCRQELFTKISIEDTGKGIAPERQATIFTRFYREPEVHDKEGIGIGLYLAREIITLQNGYIEVQSQIGQLLETLNISDKQEMLPAMLSGGEQQRVAIIRALATKPAIILADDCDIIGLTRKNPIKSRVLSC